MCRYTDPSLADDMQHKLVMRRDGEDRTVVPIHWSIGLWMVCRGEAVMDVHQFLNFLEKLEVNVPP